MSLSNYQGGSCPTLRGSCPMCKFSCHIIMGMKKLVLSLGLFVYDRYENKWVYFLLESESNTVQM